MCCKEYARPRILGALLDGEGHSQLLLTWRHAAQAPGPTIMLATMQMKKMSPVMADTSSSGPTTSGSALLEAQRGGVGVGGDQAAVYASKLTVCSPVQLATNILRWACSQPCAPAALHITTHPCKTHPCTAP